MNGMLEVLKLVQVLGEVTGRKKLQKLVHILKSQGHPFPQTFGYLHYGPYSSELASELDALSKGNLLVEDGGAGQYEPFVYRPTEQVEEILKGFTQAAGPDWAALATTLNSKDANFLEALSTLLYLRQNGFQKERLKQRFSELKPNLKSIFDEAIEFAKRRKMW